MGWSALGVVVKGWLIGFFQDECKFGYVLMIHGYLIGNLLDQAENASNLIKRNAQFQATLNELDKI